MILSFHDDLQKIRRKQGRVKGTAPKITLVTGALAAPSMRDLAEVLVEKNWADAQVAEIKNTYWGGNVGCAGLIMAQEIVAQLAGMDIGEMMFLPPDAVDKQNRMLDDITLDTLSQKFNTRVRCDANGPLQLTKILAAL